MNTKHIIVSAVARPYTLTFHTTGAAFPLSSDDAQRLLDRCAVVAASPTQVVLATYNDGPGRSTLRPATLGGGPAFIITRA